MPPWWSRPWASRPTFGGAPASANGASSFHLHWVLDESEPLVEVAAVLEVVVPPAVDRLYFWALQVSFEGGDASHGAAHTGLQWNRNHPGGRAVNWGGYAEGGGLLPGSASGLASAPSDPNTRDYPWEPGRSYRLRVFRAPGPPGSWRAEVTDLRSGHSAVIRDLAAGGDRLAHPIVWSEVFARCDDPSVTGPMEQALSYDRRRRDGGPQCPLGDLPGPSGRRLRQHDRRGRRARRPAGHQRRADRAARRPPRPPWAARRLSLATTTRIW